MKMRGFMAGAFLGIALAVFVSVMVGAVLSQPIHTAVVGVNNTYFNGTNYIPNPALVNMIPNIDLLYIVMLLLIPIVGVMALAAIIS